MQPFEVAIAAIHDNAPGFGANRSSTLTACRLPSLTVSPEEDCVRKEGKDHGMKNVSRLSAASSQ
jgi:hypothetical protein